MELRCNFTCLNQITCPLKVNRFQIEVRVKWPGLIILVTKQMIFRAKCAQSPLHWTQIESKHSLLYDIELYNAAKQQKLDKHVAKWRFIQPE